MPKKTIRQLDIFPPPVPATDTDRSWFDTHTVDDLHQSILSAYRNPRHGCLIVGLSGGKDSRAAAQLTWNAIARHVQPKDRLKPVYILGADTRIEVPEMSDALDETLRRINLASGEQDMPVHAAKVTPPVSSSFWVMMLGYRYASPTMRFRWCVTRLKIDPIQSAIETLTRQHGDSLTILGLRGAESTTRRTRIARSLVEDTDYLANPANPRNALMAPINRLTNDDVWTYLLQSPCPWHEDNRDLLALYRSATGECPLVLEIGTTSCAANSRFGCAFCTVIDKNRSLEAMIDNEGADHLLPMLELRNFLALTTQPEHKLEYRSTIGRDGSVKQKHDGSVMPRGYTVQTCRTILSKLLHAQQELRRHTPDACLISLDELQEIRRLSRDAWKDNSGDWVGDVWLSSGEHALPPIPEPRPALETSLQIGLWDDLGDLNHTDDPHMLAQLDQTLAQHL